MKLADRYMNDRFFPDKAIDVIDEACARARLSVCTVPSEIHDLEKKLEEVVEGEGSRDPGPGVREGRPAARQGEGAARRAYTTSRSRGTRASATERAGRRGR